MNVKVPLLRPQLPSIKHVAPYIKIIDAGRLYSNFGPLVKRLEDRLGKHFDLATGSVGTVANGTLGLTLSLISLGVRPDSLCIIPSWTFAATPHAAVAAGLKPWFVDVDDNSWALSPEMALQAMEKAPGKVGAVMPVAPFGYPINIDAWDEFHHKTGINVVIDAAAGFEGLKPGHVPTIVSLHATKILGAGEGGFAISTDGEFMEEFRRRSNFGFNNTREASVSATNAKMSEYHAAVALAALDTYFKTSEAYYAIMQHYRSYCKALGTSVTFQDGHGEDWVSTTCVVRAAAGFAHKAAGKLNTNGIETRSWWGRGAHHHPAFSHFKRGKLTITEDLSDTTLGLPCFPDMSERDIETICSLLVGI